MFLKTGTAPLLNDRDGERALAIAERIFERALRWTDENADAPETIGEYGGCVLVLHALLSAGRTASPTLVDVVRRALVTAPDRRGLYDGRAGLLVVLDTLDPEGIAFTRPRAALRAAIAADVLATRDLDPAVRTSFDLISGVAGKVIALRDLPDDVGAHVRELFASFAGSVEARVADPRPNAAPLDIGVAHGVPGILAALNLGLPQERALARRYTELIIAMSHHTGGTRRWNSHWERDAVAPPRRAWCYQTAGVAAVLHDRARLDDDRTLLALALDALDGTLREPEMPNWDDGICHGRSGVALIYSRIETEDQRFARAAQQLAKTVLNGYREDAPFGYSAFNLVRGVAEDRPQFLDAALGIAMFLIDAARPAERRWLPLLGLLPGGAVR